MARISLHSVGLWTLVAVLAYCFLVATGIA
ncbi:hypothetical protein ABIC83_000283 [Roseateles asaccharophilus]|uniref:Uncharacterized protein n=1 Tax=Roseateles asaccharophilus TaxID=582607 RepID=A0ABU2A9Y8_9BURK|nr:hypothetical protein [Roseateles asaccharophilus]